MMSYHQIGVILCLAILWGCAAPPIKQEVQLPSQVLNQVQPAEGSSFVVIYNDSNRVKYGIDGSGKINITLDGKGVGQLAIGEYVMVETSPGIHTVHLLHRDIMNFDSTHEFPASDRLRFVKIYSKMTSNGLEVTGRPRNFESEFSPAY